MKDNRIEELTEYFARLGLEYTGDRRAWHRNGSDWIKGLYRGVMLYVSGERARDGKEISGYNYTNQFRGRTTTYRAVYRNYLQLAIAIGAPVAQPVAVIPRNHYALLSKQGFPVVNGEVMIADGPDSVGTDMRYSQYLAFNRILDGGVPEFDAAFGVLCDDEAYAHGVLPPDALRWIAGDQRSYGTRLLFKDDRLNFYLRTQRQNEPPELFIPEYIFPAADYLIDLLSRTAHRPSA